MGEVSGSERSLQSGPDRRTIERVLRILSEKAWSGMWPLRQRSDTRTNFRGVLLELSKNIKRWM